MVDVVETPPPSPRPESRLVSRVSLWSPRKTASIASWQPRPGRNPYDRDSNRASHSGSRALATRACNARSAITGMPSGRCFPFALGMNTRLTARAVQDCACCCTQSASSAFCCGSNAVFPSIPAVLRPALSCATRRTLSSVLEWDRSISFCRFLTLARSPACDAVKIRCRKRLTLLSAASQSTWDQSTSSSSGPFIPPCPGMMSNLSFGSSVVVISLSTGSPDPRQPSFESSTSWYPASYTRLPAEELISSPRFPAAFRPPAFASLVILRPLRNSAFLTVGLPEIPDLNGVVTFRTSKLRSEWAPLNPGTAVLAWPHRPLGQRLPLPSGQSCSPAPTSHLRAQR